MPAAYAHYVFGEACLQAMPDRLKTVCERYRDLYDIGVHGPDILFYYKALESNEVNRYGSELHRRSGRYFFKKARKKYERYPDKGKMLAYLMGFLAHYALDSTCHGYVNEMVPETGLSHNLLESQYEVFLMKMSGSDPMKVDRSSLVHPTMQNADVISRFFPFDQKQVLKAMNGQEFTLRLFYSPSGKKKQVLRSLIGRLSVNSDFGNLFLDKEERPECVAVNNELYNLQQQALQLYPKLQHNLMQYLYRKAGLGDYFCHDFEGGIVCACEEPQE